MYRVLSNQEHDTLIKVMEDNMEFQDESKVGIFWYDPKKDVLFGVCKTEASDVKPNAQGQKTSKTLHRNEWQKQKNRCISKGITDTPFKGDYTQVPRGRVWQDEETSLFYITVGSWISEYPEARPLIIDEFDLTDDVEFRIDEHWEIGHGWSE